MAKEGIQFNITTTNIKDVEKFIEAMPARIEAGIIKGFNKYVRQHLVPRMKQRLQNATQPMSTSTLDDNMNKSSVGGYGLPENPADYKEWKQTRSNLPLKGDITPRTLVATGHFLDSIDVTHFVSKGKDFSYTVGPKPGIRPAVKPFRDNPEGALQEAAVSYVENSDVAKWIEDSRYAFLAKEYEDVQKDVIPLVKAIVLATIKELAEEFIKHTKESLDSK